VLSRTAIGAAAACVLVLSVGVLIRQPLAKVPENSLKFLVGAMLSGFGVFWTAEGLGAAFPLGDWAIAGLDMGNFGRMADGSRADRKSVV
jgi:uncharacterized membrane protein